MGNNRMRNVPTKLDPDMMIECQWCGNKHTVDEWDKSTMEECTTRKMRKDYLTLRNVRTFNKKENTTYKCPSCSRWSNSNQLVLLTDNKLLRRLGGEPIIQLDDE